MEPEPYNLCLGPWVSLSAQAEGGILFYEKIFLSFNEKLLRQKDRPESVFLGVIKSNQKKGSCHVDFVTRPLPIWVKVIPSVSEKTWMGQMGLF